MNSNSIMQVFRLIYASTLDYSFIQQIFIEQLSYSRYWDSVKNINKYPCLVKFISVKYTDKSTLIIINKYFAL